MERRMEEVKQFFVESIMRRFLPIQPTTEMCHEAALVFRRPARVALLPEKLGKPVDEKCQRSNAGLHPSRYADIILVIHCPTPLVAGEKSPARDDSRIMPSYQLDCRL
jgi:hypothetical protein